MSATSASDPEFSHEHRLGLVLYGGVSLAIYIYGVADEFFRAVRGRGIFSLIKALTDSALGSKLPVAAIPLLGPSKKGESHEGWVPPGAVIFVSIVLLSLGGVALYRGADFSVLMALLLLLLPVIGLAYGLRALPFVWTAPAQDILAKVERAAKTHAIVQNR